MVLLVDLKPDLSVGLYLGLLILRFPWFTSQFLVICKSFFFGGAATGGRVYGSRSGECLQHWPALGTGSPMSSPFF
jgi:hypothetical protein